MTLGANGAAGIEFGALVGQEEEAETVEVLEKKKTINLAMTKSIDYYTDCGNLQQKLQSVISAELVPAPQLNNNQRDEWTGIMDHISSVDSFLEDESGSCCEASSGQDVDGARWK